MLITHKTAYKGAMIKQKHTIYDPVMIPRAVKTDCKTNLLTARNYIRAAQFHLTKYGLY